MIPILTCVTLLQLEQNTGQTLTQHHVVTVVTGPGQGRADIVGPADSDTNIYSECLQSVRDWDCEAGPGHPDTGAGDDGVIGVAESDPVITSRGHHSTWDTDHSLPTRDTGSIDKLSPGEQETGDIIEPE